MTLWSTLVWKSWDVWIVKFVMRLKQKGKKRSQCVRVKNCCARSLFSLHLMNSAVLGFLLFHGSYTVTNHFFLCNIPSPLNTNSSRSRSSNSVHLVWPCRCFKGNLLKLESKIEKKGDSSEFKHRHGPRHQMAGLRISKNC